MITYAIEINKENYEIKKLKKLKRFTVTVKINENILLLLSNLGTSTWLIVEALLFVETITLI